MTTYSSEMDDFGQIDESCDGDELVLTWVEPPSVEMEVMRYNRNARTLRIFPKRRKSNVLSQRYSRIVEIVIDGSNLPNWNADGHTEISQLRRRNVAIGLPEGFYNTYCWGIGVHENYEKIVKQVEIDTPCTVLNLSDSADEGIDGTVFSMHFSRYRDYVVMVDRNKRRAHDAVTRVIDSDTHNELAAILERELISPFLGRNPVVRAITEEILTGHVTSRQDREALLRETSTQAKSAIREAPEQFGRLQQNIELVSLERLIEQFDAGLSGGQASKESFWQDFFNKNPFALQQMFSAPIVVYGEKVNVRVGGNTGARFVDFLLANAVTKSALLVEIKHASSQIMKKDIYRGSRGSGAEVHQPHEDLTGAVAQLQSQIESMVQDYRLILMGNKGLGGIETYTARGVVVVGQIESLSPEQKTSFLRYRKGLTDVEVLTFDEVRDRLRGLESFLSEEIEAPPMAPSAPGEEVP